MRVWYPYTIQCRVQYKAAHVPVATSMMQCQIRLYLPGRQVFVLILMARGLEAGNPLAVGGY